MDRKVRAAQAEAAKWKRASDLANRDRLKLIDINKDQAEKIETYEKILRARGFM